MMRFAAIGLDHRHIYYMVTELIAAGAQCVGYCPKTFDPRVLKGFRERLPDLRPQVRQRLLDDPHVDIICCAAISRDRAGIAIQAMRNGKDVMVDKPGLTTPGQLADVSECVARTGRIFSICFFRALRRARLGNCREAGGGGCHRRGGQDRRAGAAPAELRHPPGLVLRALGHGGVLVDIASHQIDQFLFYTGAAGAQIVASSTANHVVPDIPDFSDVGEILLRSANATGYIRVDWSTPDSLPSWGDGRLTLLGTKGFIELRKYLDISGRAGADHVFLSVLAGSSTLPQCFGTRALEASKLCGNLNFIAEPLRAVGVDRERATGKFRPLRRYTSPEVVFDIVRRHSITPMRVAGSCPF